MFRQLKAFIFQDHLEESEAKQVCVLLRLTAIVMCTYFLCLAGILFFIGSNLGVWLSLILLFSFGALCMSIGHTNHRFLTRCTFFLMITWMILYFYEYGWDFGTQHFVFVLVVMAFTIYRGSLRGKFGIALLSSTVWLFLFICRFQFHLKAKFPLDVRTDNILHIVNTFFVFAALSSLMLAFTRESLEMQQRLKRQASIDPLTGLLNRRGMQEYLSRELDAYQEGTISRFSMAMGDIDFFKRVNDVYGHECGDLVLKTLARLFREEMKQIGAVSRWGGEEFLFSFHDYGKDQALPVLQRLQQKLTQLEIPYKNNRLKITMTFGLVEFDYRHNMDYSIDEADKKLYCGKESGRNRIIH